MKRLVLSAVALSMLALPVAQAQAGPRDHQAPRYEYQQKQNKHSNSRKWQQHKSHDSKRYQKSAKKHHWKRGHKVPSWQRRHVVKDYHRYGLRRPAPGQQWIKVDNDFLLISIASGLIGGIFASQF